MKQPPCCLQGSAEAWAGLAILFSPAQMAWPCGSGQRQDGRTAGWQDGRTQALPERHRRVSAPVRFSQTQKLCWGSSGHIWRSVSPGFYSPIRIFTAHNHRLFLRTPPVCAGRPCVIRFLPSSPPATAWLREPRSPWPGKEGSH